MISQKGFIMTHIHKKFSGDQVKILLSAYEAGHLSRDEIEDTLGIGKTRFFALFKQFRDQLESFLIHYQRRSQMRLRAEVKENIRGELQRGQALVEKRRQRVCRHGFTNSGGVYRHALKKSS